MYDDIVANIFVERANVYDVQEYIFLTYEEDHMVRSYEPKAGGVELICDFVYLRDYEEFVYMLETQYGRGSVTTFEL